MPEVRPEFRDPRANRAATGLAIALRSDMMRAGWSRIDGLRDDDFERAESQYREDTEQEPPVFGTVKFRMGEKWYLFDTTRPALRRALELHKPKGKRSLQAQYLASLLHADELHREHVTDAMPKLLELLQEIKPFN